jgi:AraC-like DNA-binding protein
MRITADDPEVCKAKEMLDNVDMVGMVLCTKGELTVQIDSKIYKLAHRDMYIFLPSFFLRIESITSDFEAIVIQTDYDFVIPLINKTIDIRSQLLMRDAPCISLTKEEYSSIKLLMESLSERIKLENTSNFDARRKKIMRELIMSMGTTLCYEAVNIFFSNIAIQPIQLDRNDVVVQQFLIALYQNFRIQHSVGYYAQLQYLSPSYFSTVIKNKTGKSALQWIIEFIIRDAKQMLQFTDTSIKEIAIRLNFPSQTFFGKYFKQYVGISPKEYRKAERKK